MSEPTIQPYSWQEPAVTRHLSVLESHLASLDASDTGIGKTIVALQVAKERNQSPLIICPKAVKTAWRETAEQMNVPIQGTYTIQKLKNSGTPFLDKSGKNNFRWNLEPGSLVIWDEVHQASGATSQNAYALASLKAFGIKTLMLSATAADSPMKLRAIGYLLGLHEFRNFYSWAFTHGCYRNPWGGMMFSTSKNTAQRFLEPIHTQIFPERGCRLRIEDVPEFPETAIFAQAYDVGVQSEMEIREIYDAMDLDLEDAEDNPLTIMLRARQLTEIQKIPLLLELVEASIEDGKAVILFVSFRETVSRLYPKLRDLVPGSGVSLIQGDQSETDRADQVKRFLADTNRICLCTTGAGGAGLSLHDARGEFPRVSYITPTFSALELKQVLGRPHRAVSQSKSLQYIVYAAGTVEEKACNAVRSKLRNISLLNDNDLTTGINL